MRGDQTLDDLHDMIFSAFDRYDHHSYAFYFPKRPARRPQTGARSKTYASPRGFEPEEMVDINQQHIAGLARLGDLKLKGGTTVEILDTILNAMLGFVA